MTERKESEKMIEQKEIKKGEGKRTITKVSGEELTESLCKNGNGVGR